MMSGEGIPTTSTPYQKVYTELGRLKADIGYKVPRSVIAVAELYGLSPGTLRLWQDAEIGWKVEARARPSAPPIYKNVSDDLAMTIIKGELTHEAFMELLVPDPYIGE